MKIFILIVLASQISFAQTDWQVFSKTKHSTGTGDFAEMLQCRFYRTFLGTYTTGVHLWFHKMNPNTQSVWDMMLKDGHQGSFSVDGKDHALCAKVEDLRSEKWGEFKTENTVYTNGETLKEVIHVEFSNGLKFTSEETYTIRK